MAASRRNTLSRNGERTNGSTAGSPTDSKNAPSRSRIRDNGCRRGLTHRAMVPRPFSVRYLPIVPIAPRLAHRTPALVSQSPFPNSDLLRPSPLASSPSPGTHFLLVNASSQWYRQPVRATHPSPLLLSLLAAALIALNPRSDVAVVFTFADGEIQTGMKCVSHEPMIRALLVGALESGDPPALSFARWHLLASAKIFGRHPEMPADIEALLTTVCPLGGQRNGLRSLTLS